MTTCGACGNTVPDKNTYCTSCGALSAGGDHARQPDEDYPAADRDGKGVLTWERKIPLITNPYLVLQSIAIPLGIGIFFGAFFWLITGAQEMMVLFVVLGGFLALVFLLVMFVLQVVTGGGLLTMFFISSEGVAHRAGSVTAGLDGAATAGSILAGSLGGTGAGLLAKSQEHNILAWDEIRYISVHPPVRSLVFRSRWLISPVVLYCTEENFPRVLAMVREHAPPAAAGSLDR